MCKIDKTIAKITDTGHEIGSIVCTPCKLEKLKFKKRFLLEFACY
jgi:hypothetical protein